MKPLRFPEANRVLTAPPGQDDVVDLHVFRDETYDTVVSCWEVDDADLAEIFRERRVWLRVRGGTHPPLSVFPERPFEDPEIPMVDNGSDPNADPEISVRLSASEWAMLVARLDAEDVCEWHARAIERQIDPPAPGGTN